MNELINTISPKTYKISDQNFSELTIGPHCSKIMTISSIICTYLFMCSSLILTTHSTVLTAISIILLTYISSRTAT